jgi:hypothetical protein
MPEPIKYETWTPPHLNQERPLPSPPPPPKSPLDLWRDAMAHDRLQEKAWEAAARQKQ